MFVKRKGKERSKTMPLRCRLVEGRYYFTASIKSTVYETYARHANLHGYLVLPLTTLLSVFLFLGVRWVARLIDYFALMHLVERI